MAFAVIIITEYCVEFNLENEGICQSYESPTCPVCCAALKLRDRRKRIMKREGGETFWIWIRRLYCPKCRKLHNELPDCLSPFKHYSAEDIEGVLDGFVTEDDEDSCDYPCADTMMRWKGWIKHNRRYIEGYLHNVGCLILKLGTAFLRTKESIFELIRKTYQSSEAHWLGIINKLVYNTGGSLEPWPPSAP